MEAIKCKVVWSWIGMRAFLQKCAHTTNSFTTLVVVRGMYLLISIVGSDPLQNSSVYFIHFCGSALYKCTTHCVTGYVRVSE